MIESVVGSYLSGTNFTKNIKPSSWLPKADQPLQRTSNKSNFVLFQPAAVGRTVGPRLDYK